MRPVVAGSGANESNNNSSSSDDTDDDDEEEELSRRTYLGFSGRMVTSKEVDAVDAYATKVGGAPKFSATEEKGDDDDEGNETTTMSSLLSEE